MNKSILTLNIDDFNKYLINKYPEIKTLFLSRNNNIISLDLIEIKKEFRNNGIGTLIMKDLINYADSNMLGIDLLPAMKDDKHGTTSRSRLVKFYKKFGFVENSGRNKDFSKRYGGMYRSI